MVTCQQSQVQGQRSKVRYMYRWEHKVGHGRLRHTVTSHLQEATPGDQTGRGRHVSLASSNVRHQVAQRLLLSFAFHDLKFCLSSQLKAACALCSSEMPPSKQVNGHSFTTFGVHRSRRVARRCNPTHAYCCGMVPRLIGTGLAGSIGHGAGPFPVAGW